MVELLSDIHRTITVGQPHYLGSSAKPDYIT